MSFVFEIERRNALPILTNFIRIGAACAGVRTQNYGAFGQALEYYQFTRRRHQKYRKSRSDGHR